MKNSQENNKILPCFSRIGFNIIGTESVFHMVLGIFI